MNPGPAPSEPAHRAKQILEELKLDSPQQLLRHAAKRRGYGTAIVKDGKMTAYGRRVSAMRKAIAAKKKPAAAP